MNSYIFVPIFRRRVSILLSSSPDVAPCSCGGVSNHTCRCEGNGVRSGARAAARSASVGNASIASSLNFTFIINCFCHARCSRIFSREYSLARFAASASSSSVQETSATPGLIMSISAWVRFWRPTPPSPLAA